MASTHLLLDGALTMLSLPGVPSGMRLTLMLVSIYTFPLQGCHISFNLTFSLWRRWCCVGCILNLLWSIRVADTYESLWHSDCLGSYNPESAVYTDIALDNAGRSWTWIVYVLRFCWRNIIWMNFHRCNEVGFLQVTYILKYLLNVSEQRWLFIRRDLQKGYQLSWHDLFNQLMILWVDDWTLWFDLIFKISPFWFKASMCIDVLRRIRLSCRRPHGCWRCQC